MSPAKPRFLPHLPADFLAEHQLAGIRWAVQQAMKSPQYRAKLAAALVEGRPLRIEGGAYRLCEGGGEHCGRPCRRRHCARKENEQ